MYDIRSLLGYGVDRPPYFRHFSRGRRVVAAAWHILWCAVAMAVTVVELIKHSIIMGNSKQIASQNASSPRQKPYCDGIYIERYKQTIDECILHMRIGHMCQAARGDHVKSAETRVGETTPYPKRDLMLNI